MAKPVVNYSRAVYVKVGDRADLRGVLNHPRGLRGDWVSTSTVLSYDKHTGTIETLNTLYVPMEK